VKGCWESRNLFGEIHSAAGSEMEY
jgi:hypothetical protein